MPPRGPGSGIAAMTSGRDSRGVISVIRAMMFIISRPDARYTAFTMDTKALYETQTSEAVRMAMDKDVCSGYAGLINEA
jgi:hypothetical protein